MNVDIEGVLIVMSWLNLIKKESEMDKEGKFWVTIVATITLGIVLFAGTLSHLGNVNKLNMTKNGYEQVQKTGTTDFIWQKVKETPKCQCNK